jgi:amino acid transporter
MLTISISIASGVDAVFSFLPLSTQIAKLEVEIALVILLLVLNLRGMRESIKVLLPIFLGFFITHALVIFLGIGMHADRIPDLGHSSALGRRQLQEHPSQRRCC